jgi:hypothetical protein
VAVPLPNLTGGAAGPSTASSNSGFDNSGFVVNMGAGSGGGLPQWAVLALILGGAVWLLRRR